MSYWLRVLALYALAEAVMQLFFYILINLFITERVTIPEHHVVMWMFQCLFIVPIWLLAQMVYRQSIFSQIVIHAVFYVIYCYVWFGPVQDAFVFLYNQLQEITRPVSDRQAAVPDRSTEFSYLRHQLLKHSFRLAWFYVAAFFYKYRQEEKQRIELALANKELQLKTLKWHLNPSFYFKTIHHLKQVAQVQPFNAVEPILQLSKTMEYVIYEAKEKLIAVKKELVFLENYIQLLNVQEKNNCRIVLSTGNNYGSLAIAPLLLNALLDELMALSSKNEQTEYVLHITFHGNNMHISITMQKALPLLLSPGSTILNQLEQQYKDRFTYHQSNNKNSSELILQLDEV
jgi:hypothetical protein